jgi:hypothetical protein
MVVGGGGLAGFYLLQVVLTPVREAKDIAEAGNLWVGVLIGLAALVGGLVLSFARRK